MLSKFLTVTWNAPTCVKTLITTRVGNEHHALGFNLATHVGDDLKAVMANRHILAKELPNKPHWLNQTHSNNVLNLDNLSKSVTPPQINKNAEYDNFDAAITYKKNAVCVVMTADCLPILLTDMDGSFVAAIHAGRAGIANGIIANTIKSSNVSANNILAYIGPAICGGHYEIGEEIFEQFMQLDKQNQKFFTPKPAESEYAKSAPTIQKFDCDLIGIAKLQLINLGLSLKHIYQSEFCTYCNNDMFYSYRKELKTGRFASLIWLE